ncbi:metal-dependent hydrolase [Candidatus Woesearchaeota archaeon]|nr:metal-dependent hydrolase [Candidatus Woesearchaeota archaeon]
MNTPLHFLINYLVIQLFLKNANEYLLPIAFFSMILDLDHIKYWWVNRKKVKQILFSEGVDFKSRSAAHELIGFGLIVLIGVFGFLYANDKLLVVIIVSCLCLHILLDFLTGSARPFYPFSGKVVKSPFYIEKWRNRVIFEAVLTIFMGFIFYSKW